MARIALLSVSNKDGLLPLAKTLVDDFEFQLVSSGGTAKLLEDNFLPVTRVADFTGAPEILNGRVKTLHPNIHGGILAKRNDAAHKSDLEQQKIKLIDLVVVNLYPFIQTVEDPNVDFEKAIENIDIGGPTMIRAAAKNHSDVSILTRPDQYIPFIKALNKGKGFVSTETRKKLALEAFEHTAIYDIAISNWLSKKNKSNTSHWLHSFPIKQRLRYGENPHQEAIWYSNHDQGWGDAIQLQGKELSTNNLLDLEAAICTVQEFGYGSNEKNDLFKPAAVVIKHTNPCGVAISDSISQALIKALEADKVSAFGGIVALNRSVDGLTANTLSPLFLECVVAPKFTIEAKEILSKKSNLRLLELNPQSIFRKKREHIRSIFGGLLIQEQDDDITNTDDWDFPTISKPTQEEIDDLHFAWKLVRHVRSNAIVVAAQGQSLGIGAGQMNRVGSAKLALEAAGAKSKNGVLASDGFFPFADTVKLASKYGIKAIIQPGGSIRDKESIEECNEQNISMIFTGKRHFLH